MIIYYVAMVLAVLFLFSAAMEVFSVVSKGPSWKALWTATGSLLLALICFMTGVWFH